MISVRKRGERETGLGNCDYVGGGHFLGVESWLDITL